ncbi:MAG TPA: hypothetical protein VGL77_10360, partial [Armatimonadota bacterium]
LRLDVQAEVLSHLEDTAACVVAEEGKSDDEAADFAARTFGSPVDLADTMRDANRARMKTRALLRLAVRALLIPAALVLAVYLGYGRLVRVQGVYLQIFPLVANTQERPDIPKLPRLELPSTRQRRGAREAAVERMRGTWDNLDNLHALWEQHRQDPDARAYYAYYTNFIALPYEPPAYLIDPSARSKKEMARERSESHYPGEAVDLKSETQQGTRIDPSNALYHYKLAAYYLDRGIYAQAEQAPRPGVQRVDIVMDPQMMERGIAEFRAGLRQSTLRFYARDMLQKRLALLPASRYTEDYLERTTCAGRELFPQFGHIRRLLRKVSGCARVLIAQGRLAEANTLLRAWKPFNAQLTAGSDSFILVVVTNALATEMAQASADAYRRLGQQAQAQRTLDELARFTAPVAAWKTHRRQETAQAKIHNYFDDMSGAPNSQARSGLDPHARYGSVLAATISAFSPVTRNPEAVDAMATLARHERIFITEALVSLLMVVLTLALLWHALRGAYLLLAARGKVMAPLLLLPPWPVTAKILGLGVVLPVGVYLLYAQTPQLSGQFESYRVLVWRVSCESGVLLISLLALPALLATQYLRRRCLALGLPPLLTPEERRERRRVVRVISVYVGWCGLVAALGYVYQASGSSLLSFLLPLALSAILLIIIIRWHRAHMQPRPAQLVPTSLTFRGTMSRSLVPVYALAVILLAAVQPYLKEQEAHWLAQDRLFLIRDQFNGITPLEGRLARTLQHDMLQQAEAMHFLEAGR